MVSYYPSNITVRWTNQWYLTQFFNILKLDTMINCVRNLALK